MSTAEKTRRQRQRKALAPGNKGHHQRRVETMALNDVPNDAIRREESLKVKACQRCHHKFAKQFTVVLGDNGRVKVAYTGEGSHYCSDCADERKAELERFDARPKKRTRTEEKAKAATKRKRRSQTPKEAKKVAAKVTRAPKGDGSLRSNAKLASAKAEKASAEEPF